jgi:hypothetical protein
MSKHHHHHHHDRDCGCSKQEPCGYQREGCFNNFCGGNNATFLIFLLLLILAFSLMGAGGI